MSLFAASKNVSHAQVSTGVAPCRSSGIITTIITTGTGTTGRRGAFVRD